jgi:hypothetical protein
MGRWVIQSLGALLLICFVTVGLYALSRWKRRTPPYR